MTSRTQIKENAQNDLMIAMQTAFSYLDGYGTDSPEWIAMDKQFRRVEKLFGYQEGSWNRGV